MCLAAVVLPPLGIGSYCPMTLIFLQSVNLKDGEFCSGSKSHVSPGQDGAAPVNESLTGMRNESSGQKSGSVSDWMHINTRLVCGEHIMEMERRD